MCIIQATQLDLREGMSLKGTGWICVWHIQQQLLKVQLLPDDTTVQGNWMYGVGKLLQEGSKAEQQESSCLYIPFQE